MAKKVSDKVPEKESSKAPKTTKKRKSPATRKKVVEDIPDEEPKVVAKKDESDAPADLRGKKRRGRPSNAERANTDNIDEEISLLCAEWISDIRKERKNIPIVAKIKALPSMLNHLVRDNETDDESDLTMIILAEKYLDGRKKFEEAERISKDAAQNT